MKSRSLKILGISILALASVSGGTAALAGAPAAGEQVVVRQPLVAQIVPAAAVTVDLCASNGSVTLPDSTSVPVWGFVDGTSGCTTGAVNDSNFPGPTIELNDGDTVTINLTNALSENVSILIPGQQLSASGGTAGTFTTEAPAGGGTVTYTFTARPGTFLYESGTNPRIQVPMGLYGALVVDAAVDQAYAGSDTGYDTDAVLVLSEIDPNLNANPSVYDEITNPTGFDLLDYHPTYWLLNGKAYPDTTSISAAAGDRVLVRYLNAGFDNLSMAVLGAHQRVVAKDGYELANAFDAVAEIIPAGNTADVIVDTAGLDGPFPLYNRNGYLTNGDSFPGGMLTAIEVTAPTGDKPTVSVTTPSPGATVSGGVPIAIQAADTEDADGTLIVEWTTDGGATWNPTTATSGSTSYTATWTTTAADDGLKTITARATDSDSNAATASATVTVSNAPTVSFTPTAGTVVYGDASPIVVTAADAADAEGSLSVEVSTDGGATWTLATWVSGTTYESSINTLPPAIPDGPLTISVRATDSDSNSTTVDHVVSVSNAPVGGLVSPADGATVSGVVPIQVEANDAEDPPGTLTVTFAVDGGTPSAPMSYSSGLYRATWDSGSVTPGSHTIDVTIADSRGNITDGATITVATGNAVHIGDLDDASVQAGGPNWSARVTAAVHDVNHAAVAGATVYMDVTRIAKQGGSVTENLSCVTTATGRCTINRTVNQNQYENDVTFTVTGVTSAAPYAQPSNHDPDAGDSDGTTITVAQP